MGAPWPRVSVVVPARNAAESIADQIAALAGQEYPGWWEVVVVDNGSTDGTAAVVQAVEPRPPNLRVVGAACRGVPAARNAGARATSGDLLLFCDADDVVAPGWVQAMATSYRHGARVLGGMLDRRTLNHRDLLAPEQRDAPTSAIGESYGFLPFVFGANLGIDRALYCDVGGSREWYPVGANDVELTWRVQLEGHAITTVEDAIVHYRERPDPRTLFGQFYQYGVASALLYRDFRSCGMPRDRLAVVVKVWARLLLSAPRALAVPWLRRRWLRRVATRVGRAVGSVRWRVVYL